MTDETPSDPSIAFDTLRAEIALMRRGVEQLAAERADFRPTIEELVTRQDNVVEALKRVYNAPPIKLTPAQFAQDFSRATEHLRAQDREAVAEADRAIQRAIGKIEAVVSRANTVVEQKRRLIQSALAGAGAAVILWSILPGAIARALPESWHVPEWMATRTMAMSERDAGERLAKLAGQRDLKVNRGPDAAPKSISDGVWPAVGNDVASRGQRAANSRARQAHRKRQP